jgi:hypothetical protein
MAIENEVGSSISASGAVVGWYMAKALLLLDVRRFCNECSVKRSSVN